MASLHPHHDYLPVMDIKLAGSANFQDWSCTLQAHLAGRGYWGHLDGSDPRPSTLLPTDGSSLVASADSSALDVEWMKIDLRIKSYIIGAVEVQFRQMIQAFSTTRDIWIHLQGLFVEKSGVRRHHLLRLSSRADQGTRSVQEFFTYLSGIWRDLAAFEPAYPANVLAIHEADRDAMRVHQFLMSLRPEYETLAGQLIHRDPLPRLTAVLAELIGEETRIMSLRSTSTIVTPTVLAAATTRSYTMPSSSGSARAPFCNYCKTRGHRFTECQKRLRRSAPSAAPPLTSGLLGAVPYASAPPTPASDSFALSDQQLLQLGNRLQRLMASSPSDAALSASEGNSPSTWLLDSGASQHMTSVGSLLTATTPHTGSILTAGGSHLPAIQSGFLTSPSISLPNVLHVPSLSHNLISVGQLADLGYETSFSRLSCVVQDPRTGQQIGTGRRVHGLYQMDHIRLPPPTSPATPTPTSTHGLLSFDVWHRRLGHISVSRLKQLTSVGMLGPVSSSILHQCTNCRLAKQSALPFPISSSASVNAFDLIHSDIWGPAPVASMRGFTYYVSFIDDHSRYCWLYLMRHRSDIVHIYRDFTAMIDTQFGRKIKVFRSDGAREYLSSEMRSIMASHGTLAQQSCPYTSAQNGVAERKHRHILEVARSLLFSAYMPRSFWGEAVMTAVYLINRVPSTTLADRSPFECLYGLPPFYSHLRTFGCTTFVLLPSIFRDKLSPRSTRCVFLGYCSEHKGYRCYDPSTKKLWISRHCSFFEDTPYFSAATSVPAPESPSAHDLSFLDWSYPVPPPPTLSTSPPSESPSPVSPPTPSERPPIIHTYTRRLPVVVEDFVVHPLASPFTSAPVASARPVEDPTASLRRSTRPHRAPDRLGFSAVSSYSHSFQAFLTAIQSHTEPSSYHEAVQSPHWQQAIAEELSALQRTGTWDIVPLPPDAKPISCKWIFKVKTKSDGSVERYKARLVARGFQQEHGIDYDETFAPVAKMTTIRSLIAIAAVRQWPLYQLDVKNAFLHGDLSEVVYMQAPPGLSCPAQSCCRLRKALYGLKQAPRAWFQRFRNAVISAGFVESFNDYALFTRQTPRGLTVLLLYVDDMIISGDDIDTITALKRSLQRQFEMKDLGPLSYFLGLEIGHTPRGYLLSQQKYISDILQRASLSDSRSVATPMDLNQKMRTSDGEPLSDPTRYRHLVGALVYLTISRPDIAHAVHVVSQFVSAPRSVHYAAVLRILRYLRGTMTRSLLYSSSSSLELRAYSDADWAGDPNDRRSTTGFCIFLGDSLISWKSKKQDVVARSSTEAELRAMSTTSCEILWLRRLLLDLGVNISAPTPLFGDNQSAIKIANDPVFHERTKHIEVDGYFVRFHYEACIVSLPYISTLDQLADVFTKSQTIDRFCSSLSKLMLIDPP